MSRLHALLGLLAAALLASCGNGPTTPQTVNLFYTNTTERSTLAFVRGDVFLGCTNAYKLVLAGNGNNPAAASNWFNFQWPTDPKPSAYAAIPEGTYYVFWAGYTNNGLGNLGTLRMDPGYSNGIVFAAGKSYTILVTNHMTNSLTAILGGFGGYLIVEN